MITRSGPAETIDSTHKHTHKGESYHTSKYFAAVASAATVDILIKVGSGKALHANFKSAGGGDFTTQIFETPTISADGTSINIRDMNRTTASTSNATAFHTPTISATGTALTDTEFTPGGSGIATPGGVQSGVFGRGGEWILKKSTNYLIRLTNQALTAQNMSISASWYEV